MKVHSPFPRVPGFLGIVCLLLVACTPQLAPTTPPVVNTDRPTIIPSTITPEPYTPASARWPAPPVLALITSSGGMLGRQWPQFPTLVLYADGRLLRASKDGEQMLEAWLTQQQICDLLYQVEETGFFDFVQGPFPYVTDVSMVQITVNAWRSRTVYTTGLIEVVRPEQITPSPDESDMPLVRTYFTLLDYLPVDLQPYQPDRLVLSIEEVEKDRYQYTEPIPWPLTALQLSELADRAVHPWNDLVLEGDEMAALLNLFPTGTGGGIYQEGTRYYSLHSRPLLPLESLRSPFEMTVYVVEIGQPTITPAPPVTLAALSDVRAIPDRSLNLPTVEYSCGRP